MGGAIEVKCHTSVYWRTQINRRGFSTLITKHYMKAQTSFQNPQSIL